MLEINKIHCMDAIDGLKNIDSNSINCIIIDPPYNISSGKAKDYGFNVFCDNDLLYQELFRVIKEDSFLIITIRLSEAFKIFSLIEKSGFVFHRDLFWNKNRRMSDFANDIPYVHENILVFKKGSPRANVLEYIGEEYTRKGKYNQKSQCFGVGLKMINVEKKKTRKANTMIDLNQEYIIDAPNKTTMKYNERTEHPTQKPLKLWNILLSHFSNPNDLVLDCFMGSGTTACACKELGRNFIGIEKNPEYIDMANKRLQQEVL